MYILDSVEWIEKKTQKKNMSDGAEFSLQHIIHVFLYVALVK